MKKTGLIFILIVLITTKAAAYSNIPINDEMIDLATLVTEGNLSIDEWQVTIKEQLDHNRIQYTIKKLKNSYLVSTSEDENVIKYSFGDVNESSGITVSYKVIIPKNQAYKAEIIAVFHGEFWDETIKQDYHKELNILLEQYFTSNAKKFACLTTNSNDTMSNEYFISELKRKLNLKHISTQYDTVQNSTHEKNIYGYTPLWNQKFTIMDKPMNVHMAVSASENGSSKLTIGTPILITEY